MPDGRERTSSTSCASAWLWSWTITDSPLESMNPRLADDHLRRPEVDRSPDCDCQVPGGVEVELAEQVDEGHPAALRDLDSEGGGHDAPEGACSGGWPPPTRRCHHRWSG